MLLFLLLLDVAFVVLVAGIGTVDVNVLAVVIVDVVVVIITFVIL